MPYKGSKKLTEQKFNTVTAQLAKNPYTPDMVIVIAKANGIAPSTVATIHRLGTWERFATRNFKPAKTVAKTAKKSKISVEDHFERQFQDIMKRDLHELRSDMQSNHRHLLKRVKDLEEAAKEAKRLKRWWKRG